MAKEETKPDEKEVKDEVVDKTTEESTEALDKSKDESKAEDSKDESKEETKDEDSKVDPDDVPLSQLQKDIKSGKVSPSAAPVEDASDRPPTPPPKPPRPLSPFSQNYLTLSEAFPSVDTKVVRAILISSSGLVDPAFNGLLSLTDPDYKLDENLLLQQRQAARHAHTRPPPPPGKTAPRYRQAPLAEPKGGAPLNTLTAHRAAQQASAAAAIRADSAQIEEDEKLARLLAAEFDTDQRRDRRVRYADTGRGTTYSDPRDSERSRRAGNDGGYQDDGYEDDDDLYKERSFFDEDLPQLRDNLTKGFNETKEKVNNWVENFKKKIDGDEKTPGLFNGLFGNANAGSRNNSGSGASGAYYGDEGRSYNSGYRGGVPPGGRTQRFYDRDPQEVSFHGISMQDHDNSEEPDLPRLPRRPSADKNESAKKGDNKWEPLSTVSPVPSISSASATGASLEKSDSAAAATTAASTEKDGAALASAKDAEGAAEDAGAKSKVLLKSETAEDDDPFFIGDSEDDDDDAATETKKKSSK